MVIGLAVLGALGFGAYRWLIPPAAAGPSDETFPAEVMAMEEILLFAGVVKPAITIDLRADSSGIVEHVGSTHPLGRAITAEDCAEAAVFLCSDESANLTGVLVPIDGGYVAR